MKMMPETIRTVRRAAFLADIFGNSFGSYRLHIVHEPPCHIRQLSVVLLFERRGSTTPVNGYLQLNGVPFHREKTEMVALCGKAATQSSASHRRHPGVRESATDFIRLCSLMPQHVSKAAGPAGFD